LVYYLELRYRRWKDRKLDLKKTIGIRKQEDKEMEQPRRVETVVRAEVRPEDDSGKMHSKKVKAGGPGKNDPKVKRQKWIANQSKKKEKRKPLLKEAKERERRLIEKENELRKVDLDEKLLEASKEISKRQAKIEELKNMKNKVDFIRVNENVDLLKEAMNDSIVVKLISSLGNFERITKEALERKAQYKPFRREMEDLEIMMKPNCKNTFADINIVEKYRPQDFIKFKKKYEYLLGKTQKEDW
jgi:hypothetical protein